MIRKTLYALIALTALLISSCNNDQQPGKETTQTVVTKTDTVTVSQGINSKGIGRFKDVPLTHPLDATMAEKGKALYDAKCAACHKVTPEKLVGPGWKGVTDRRTPEWIMNFITNTNVMLDSDLVAQQLMVVCVARMPNQNVTDNEARNMLEFIRKNDNKN